MNQTEQAAKDWLNGQGFDVTVNKRGTPDFLTSFGSGFEVKMLTGKNIVFSPGQIEKIHSTKSKVLVYRSGASSPEAVLCPEEVRCGDVGKFRIIEQPTNNTRGMNVVVKDFPEAKWVKFRTAALKRGLTVKEAMEEATELWSDSDSLTLVREKAK